MIKRMRTIPETLKEIKELDNRTSIKENTIRKLCKENKVKHNYIGNRILVDLDDLILYFSQS